MKGPKRTYLYVGLGVLSILTGIAVFNWMPATPADGSDTSLPSAQQSLAVRVTVPLRQTLTMTIAANGDIAPWQDVSVAAEIGGLRLEHVHVDVGDVVQKGQLLAVLAADTIRADTAQARAALAEAQALLAEANTDVLRASKLENSGSLSQQQIQRYKTAQATASARRDLAQAQLDAHRLRLKQSNIVAPDDGIIVARAVSVGTVVDAGQELFRLIRQGRLEWRAEVNSAELDKLRTGQLAKIRLPGGQSVEGRVRMVAPLVESTTRNGMVYVDLPQSIAVHSGMYARGEFTLGARDALTLPRSAIQIRDGMGYVHLVDDSGRITELRVMLGQQVRDRIEITSGLTQDARVVESGGAFLGHGDQVRVIADVVTASSDTEEADQGASAIARQP